MLFFAQTDRLTMTLSNDGSKPLCSKRFGITSRALRHGRGAVKDLKYEIGGQLNIDYTKGVIDLPQTHEVVKGQFKAVVINRALADYHTHTQHCSTRECTVPLPSVADIVNVLMGGLHDISYVHFLFSQDGTFVMQAGQKLVQEASASKEQLKQLVCTLAKKVKVMHHNYASNKWSYEAYRNALLALLKQLGFLVQHFPPGVAPNAKLMYNCQYENSPPQQDIDVRTPNFVLETLRSCGR